MENRKAEILGLKRLLVGVIVAALLITILPFENMGSLVAWAENANGSTLQSGVLLDATLVEIADVTTDGKTVTAEDQILEYLNTENFSSVYPNGLILKNASGRDLDFSQTYLYFPAGKVGLDLGGYNLYTSSIDLAPMSTEEGAEQPYTSIYGEEGSSIYWNNPEVDSSETTVAIGANAQLAFNEEVNIDNLAFRIEYGQGLTIGTESFAVGAETEVRYYKANNYRLLVEDYRTGYYEALYDSAFQTTDSGERYFDIENYSCPVAADAGQFVYNAGVIPADVKIMYGGVLYENPGTALMTDYTYGLCNISGTELTIYAAMAVPDNSDGMYGGFYNVNSSAYEVNGQFTTEVEEEYEYYIVPFSKVTFAEGAIATTYTDNGVKYPIDKIIVNTKQEDLGEIVICQDGSFTIYNESMTPVQVIKPDGAETTADILVPYMEIDVANPNLDASKYTYAYDDENAIVVEGDITYIKAGTKLTLTPVDGYTIYNINDGGMAMFADSTNITYLTDGSREITIPGHSVANGIIFEIAQKEEIVATNPSTSSMYSFDKEPYKTVEAEDGTISEYYTEEFTISGYADTDYVENAETGNWEKSVYDICTKDGSEWIANGVTIDSEGMNLSLTFTLIDKSMEKIVSADTGEENVYPSATYGMEKTLTYTCSMDLASPRITGLSATDGEGNELILDGEWVDAGGYAPDLDIVWTNKVPVTISVLTDDVDVIGYAYSRGVDPEEDDWTEINSTELTQDNNYNLFFYVRDAFDAATGRLEGEWRAALGIDTTNPKIDYRDANYAPEGSEHTELVEESEYEGNLYLTVEDIGSGISTVTLYKDNAGSWVENQDALIYEGFGGYYHIVPTTENVTYRVVATDNVGNSKTYDTVVLKGYTQDISVEVTGTNSIYGEGQTISIAITNTSENPVTGLTYALRSGVTNEVFGDFSGTIDAIAAGVTETLTLTLDSTTDAGTYDAVLDINYLSEGGTDETNVQKVLTEEFSAEITKADGSGSITVEDYYFGQPFCYTLNSTTHQTGTATFYFKDVADETAEYSTEEPTAAGTYMVKAVVPETTNYKELSVETTFTIVRMEPTADMYSIPEADEVTGWYNEQVIITSADGYTIAETEDGAFGSMLIINDSVENYQFYVRTPEGAITSAVTITEIKIDMDAPVITYTDANNRDGATLMSDIEVEGNLYFIVEDTGAGVDRVALYQEIDGTWEENAEALIATTTENEYYIVSVDTDAKYRIEAADVLGNEVVYDNITIKAYAQDLSATIGETSGSYGAELNIDITITNTSTYPVQITEFGLREAETDDVFVLVKGEVEEIGAGATWSTTLQLPAGTDIGTYQAVLDVAYTTNAGYQEGTIEKTFSQTISATIGKSTGTGTITRKDFYYGEKVSFVVESTTNDASAAVFYYRNASDETAEFSTEVPSVEGSYQVQVVLPANENYEEVVLTANFNITRLSATEEMYALSGTVDENGQYVGVVTITAAEGYTISETEDGVYGSTLTFDSTVESFSFYIKTETGAITNEVVLSMAKEKIEGTGTINVDDFYYGETFTYVVESDTHDVENITLYFRDATNEDAEFTTEVPEKVGSYLVKAVLPESEIYKELTITDTFEIKRMAASAQMYSVSEQEGNNGWNTKDVVITAADGCTISPTENGTFEKTLTISKSTDAYTFYIKTQTGAITEGVVLTDIKIDKTSPEIASGEGIYAAETWWQRFLETITFNLYEAESTQVRINAHDDESGIAKISYYISENAMTLSEVKAIRNWTSGSQFTISAEDYERFIIYAKIENQAGLVTYISSNGIELEAEEEVTVIQSGTISLQKGKAYQLGEGTWNVSGDATNYAGGITFYVSEDGDYNFTQQ